MITGLKACGEQIAAESGAHMGVAIHHIETGQEVMLNADELFALASVVKVPVLVEAFRQIEENRLRLTDRWTLVQEVGAGQRHSHRVGQRPAAHRAGFAGADDYHQRQHSHRYAHAAAGD